MFARTKRGTERLAKSLVRDGFSAAMIHGDRTQSQRQSALNGFVDGKFQVLVATDVASRGIHVDKVAHVVNYDLPQVAEDFIHRVGRTGRMGTAGRALPPWCPAQRLAKLRSHRTGAEAKDRSQTTQQPRAKHDSRSPEHTVDAHPLPHAGRDI